MARGVRRQAWDHTAFLAAWVGNMFSKRRINPESIHPFIAKPARVKVSAEAFVKMLAAATGAKQV